MIRTYKLKQYANIGKEEKILDVFRSYRKAAKQLSYKQWHLFFTNQKLNKDLKSEIETKLSARYVQCCQYQVVGMLESYLSNVQNRFVYAVSNSTIPDDIKIKLYYINKYQKYFQKEINMQKKPIEQDIIRLARTIFHHLTKHKPTYKNINLNLDNKVAKITERKDNEAIGFDYWIQLSTLEKGNPIYIPVETNKYFDSKTGNRKNFVQLNLSKRKQLYVAFVKELPDNKKQYVPLTPKISIDIGLKILFATNNGDLLGRKFYSKLIWFDEKITKLQKELKKQNIPLKTNTRYNNLVEIRKSYIKNEINKSLNRLIELYSPQEIVLEDLDFQNPNMSKAMNRLINTFGKRTIENKLKCLSEEFGIIITKINPAYTSQECCSCGYVDNRNRKSQSEFLCKVCGAHKNADINASKNILARSSCQEVADIYLSRKIILDRLITKFIERNIRLCSKANDVLAGNKYFPQTCTKQLVCNICI